VRRSRLGLSGQTVPIDTRVRRFHGLTQASGMLVLDVAAAGPVAEADVQRGDVVVALGGEPIAGVDDMHRSLTAERAGRALTLTLLRRAERLEVSVIPGEA
jgi:S1-C subfamily serine protease